MFIINIYDGHSFEMTYIFTPNFIDFTINLKLKNCGFFQSQNSVTLKPIPNIGYLMRISVSK